MGKPGHNTKVSERTAEEGFNHGEGTPEILSPLTYQGRGGGNPDSPETIGIMPDPHGHGHDLKPRDPLGILDTLGESAESRGKRGGAYGK